MYGFTPAIQFCALTGEVDDKPVGDCKDCRYETVDSSIA